MLLPITAADYYFALSGWEHASLFSGCIHVWEALAGLRAYIDRLLARSGPRRQGLIMDGAWVGDNVYLAPGTVVEPGAMIKGPAIIGPGSVVRQGAYIREYCLIGAKCVVGHTSEIKGSILLDEAQAPHFNYVGDSILGRRVNLGAGVKLSNLKNDRSEIYVHVEEEHIATGLNKLGAIIGDNAAIGCNAVTSPGTLIGPQAMIYANVLVREFIPARCILKLRQDTKVMPIN